MNIRIPKIYFKLLALLLPFVVACENIEIPSLDNKDDDATCKLKVSISGFDLSISDIDTRSSIAESDLTKISFTIFDSNGNIVFSENQVKDVSTHFGEMNCSLSSGTYSIITVAHQSNAEVSVSPQSVTFEEDGLYGKEVSDTFSAYMSFSIGDEAEKNLDLNLDRVVALFQLECKDELPANIKSFKVLFSSGSNSYNPTTGLALNSKSKLMFYSVDSSNYGKPYQLSAYTFLPQDSVEMDITVTAVDTSNEEVKSYIFNKVMMARNKRVRAVGQFFQQTQTCAVNLNEDWYRSDVLEY